MGLILFVVLGAIAGWIASMVAGTNQEQGTLSDIVLGIVGALVGGFIMNFFGQTGVTGFNFYSLFVAVLGAVVLLYVVRLFQRPHLG
ncbi:MAG: GlsB/YeaQ/YmgE family stress response membrane protein [Candidatus Daviesbacteria bacterium]|nr:GlsB/YeaQ/YmgE family stress response membrane protein [Candidatus Daviesbacteria bacterium]